MLRPEFVLIRLTIVAARRRRSNLARRRRRMMRTILRPSMSVPLRCPANSKGILETKSIMNHYFMYRLIILPRWRINELVSLEKYAILNWTQISIINEKSRNRLINHSVGSSPPTLNATSTGVTRQTKQRQTSRRHTARQLKYTNLPMHCQNHPRAVTSDTQIHQWTLLQNHWAFQ